MSSNNRDFAGILDTAKRDLLTIKEASDWATTYLNKEISESNISYLIQYGKVRKYNNNNGNTYISRDDLKKYYGSFHGERELNWKKRLGNDLNWALSFDNYREKDRTKHVHRLHPYKGKFIPQLVEYFLDNHTDNYKKDVYFHKGDIVLDPFVGSGTTLVQSNELGIHSIGVDISKFNCTIAEVKLQKYDFVELEKEIRKIKRVLNNYEEESNIRQFDEELLEALSQFNAVFFPSPDFKYKVNQNKIDEDQYGEAKAKEFLQFYNKLVKKYNILLGQNSNNGFLDKWYIANIRKEINFAFELIKKIQDPSIKKIIAIVLSRTIRSCRATTHSDLATLKEPQITSYYCIKHKKICKPLFSIKSWFTRYSMDTISRLVDFDKIRTNSFCSIIPSDSRSVDIFKMVRNMNKDFYDLLVNQKIKGIFTSPPYVGQIDYHEQHAYAYDLFGFERKDELEIGPMYKGQGQKARKDYIDGIAAVLQNCKSYLADNYEIFIVANDKFNLYPLIAELAGMKIVKQFKRPVLNRTERDKSPYSECIFHFKNSDS